MTMTDALAFRLDAYEQRLRERMLHHGVPPHMHDGYVRHLVHGLPVGSFLTALLSNDLMRAVGYADAVNIERLREHVTFLYCDAPPGSYGSPEAVTRWQRGGGIKQHMGEAP